MASDKDILLGMIRGGQPMGTAQRVRLSLLLSGPAILAQLASVLMQFIDAAMVGRLGAGAAASIELVATCTWLFGGFCMACNSGFSVQVAHLVGANDLGNARKVVRQGLTSALLFSAGLAIVGLALAGPLPRWIGGAPEITGDATAYFLIFSAFLPFMQLAFLSGAMLQASGNMKVPAMLEILMCVLDVGFNYLFIFRLGMGVKGAALGTGLAELVTALLMLYFLFFRSHELRLRGERGSFAPRRDVVRRALDISLPMALQNIFMRGAHIASTVIVAPLGTVALAANGFAVTAESLCYMPGYGIADAGTTLVGQSLGAGRKDLARQFARITLIEGMSIMTFLSVLMYFGAPWMMGLMTPDAAVRALGAEMLRIEAFAETMFAASIVAYGICVGAGDTRVPSIMNFVSIWVVRIIPAIFLTRVLGLKGFWIAMCAELNVRGILFLLRIRGGRWLERKALTTGSSASAPAGAAPGA